MILHLMMIFQTIDPVAQLLWEILEVFLTLVFLGQGIYFLKKFIKEKEDSNLISLAKIDFGYAIFFFMTTINQFIYLADYNLWGLTPQLDNFFSHGTFRIFFYIGGIYFDLDNQIFMMIILFFYSLTPIMYPLEKYIQHKEKTPIYKLAWITTALITFLYVLIYIIGRGLAPSGFNGTELLWSGEITTTLGNIINIIFVVIMCLTLLTLLFLILNFVIYYLVLALKSPKGPLRSKSLLIFLGFIFFYGALVLGNGLKSEIEEVFGGWLILSGPIGFFIGNIILIWGFNKKVV